MVRWAIYMMVYLGSALMVYNIYGFIKFAHYVSGLKSWRAEDRSLNIPIFLLILFLLGYLVVGIFGNPDLIVAGILFGGSIFVFVMYKLLSRITRQIVESERLQAELIAAEESSHAKSSFLASISHEMRTPLNVILGLDGMALRNPELQPQTRDQLERIGHSARHLSSLIDGILDMQQIENGEIMIHDESFSLKDALDQINALIGTACEEKGLKYRTSFAPCATRDYSGDATQLKRALLCILENAVKFTDAPGTVQFNVGCTSVMGVCESIIFTVSDTGIGIDEVFLPKVFDPFSQEDSSFTNRFGGSGMGLTLANGIITHMGGKIDVTSNKGVGSTFTISVPLPPPPQRQSEAEARVEQEARCAHCLENRRILIVDDLPDNAEIVSDLLDMEGATTERAENGQIALEMIERSEENHYDAILMDLRMPVMDGLESARRIRALDRKDARTMPIIALTANTLDVDVQHSLEAGMNEHLVKPVDADKLYSALATWIRRTSEQSQ